MSKPREDLQTLLEDLLGSPNVYYQTPPSLGMKYPAIKYSRSRFDIKHADDIKYSNMTCYELIVIAKRPDDPVIQKLMELPYCSYDRHYTADNLNHDALTLYW